MAKNAPETASSSASSLQAMLARLRGMVEAVRQDKDEEVLPTWDAPVAAEDAPSLPVEETPAEASVRAAGEGVVPVAEAVEETLPIEALPEKPSERRLCPLCQAIRNDGDGYCGDCGFIFPPDAPKPTNMPESNDPSPRLHGRYEVKESLGERAGIARFRGLDYGHDSAEGTPVFILRAQTLAFAEAVPVAETTGEPVEAAGSDEVLPSFDVTPAQPITDPNMKLAAWPTLAWEHGVLERAHHPALPAFVESFTEDGCEYLVETQPTGRVLWDAWDDPDATNALRFRYLMQVAEALQALHESGAMLESLRPESVVVTEQGQAKITDLSELLPLPLPPDPPIKASLYTAPELAAFDPRTDARANLYSFGAMLYALHVGRELSDSDFERPGTPKPFIPRFPDIHPLVGRLVSKTFCRNIDGRFPTDEAAREDSTGFSELIRVLDVCRRTLDNVRLEIAAWTTTGMVRTGNEDAFALIHSVESRQDDLGESALILLADGMGGYEAGEIAAALAIEQLRKTLLQRPPFALLAGASTFPPNGQKPAGEPAPVDVQAMQKLIQAALKDANKFVYNASRGGIGRRGMGCTAEAVYVDGRNVVVGHVGDSRVYHLHDGRLIQLTRDQTLVNRLVELGTLTPEEAEDHPRKNELQQALGGQPDVEPGIYEGRLLPGDWIVVCSDGVSNHVSPTMLKEMLQSEATSAEMAARRLVNLVNIEGATDNATVVVVRAT